MKKLISAILLVAIFATAFAGCGKSKETVSKDRILYNVELSDYVKLGEYKGIKVDKSSEDYKAYYEDVIDTDVDSNEFFTRSEAVTEGKIEEGDIANIDYVGKKDGVAFDGGTADGYDLEIGSNSFIGGFEDGLIGVEIGSTVDLNLTFPEAYQNADLAGEDVVFTVTVNSAQKKTVQKPEEYFSKLGFDSLEAYNKDVEKRAIENFLINKVVSSSKIEKYPEQDIETLYSEIKKLISANLTSQYNMDFNGYLSAMGQTEEEFKKSVIESDIKPMMDSQMIMYAIFDAEKLSFKQSDIDAFVNKELKKISDSSVTKEQLLEYYGDYYFEAAVIVEKATDYIVKNAKVS